MAQLAAGADSSECFHPISARDQLFAIIWLRWRLFVNAFVRQRTSKRQVVRLLLTIPLRLFLWTVFAAIAAGPILAAGMIGWNEVVSRRPQSLPLLLAGIFLLWQFLSVNGLSLAANTPSFDPSSLARFPVPFGRYLILRTLVGVLTPTTIVGCLMLLSTAIGMGIARHALALPALLILATYAWTNIFFTRMLAAWLERWFAMRRFREIFTALMALSFVGPQLLSFRRLPANANANAAKWLVNLPHASGPFLRWLPPGAAVRAIYLHGRPLVATAQFLVLLAWTALFLSAFAIRLHKQFLGEYLTEGQSASKAARTNRPRSASRRQILTVPQRSGTFLSPAFRACFRKEWFDFASGSQQVIAMLIPLLFVFVLNLGIFAHHPRYFLPGATAYALLGMLPRLYNIFGADGGGVQIYLLAPIRLRDVILAKNIVSLIPVVVEASLAWMLVMLLAAQPIPSSIQASAGLWLLFLIAANLALGTLRSLQEPRKFVPGQGVKQRTPTGPVSKLLTPALLLGSLLLYIPLELGARYLIRPWLPAIVFAIFAAGAIAAYAFLLRNADQLVMTHREQLAEELCRE